MQSFIGTVLQKEKLEVKNHLTYPKKWARIGVKLIEGGFAMSFVKIDPGKLHENAIDLIGDQWMLVTAGTREKINTMTISWGGLGVLFNRPVAYIVLRPQRYTKIFVDENPTLSLTVFSPEYRNTLSYLGVASGRNEDKIAKSGLTPAFAGCACGCGCAETPYFEEAKYVFLCKKLIAQEFKPENFVDRSKIAENYPKGDFHTVYICEIFDCLQRTGDN